MNLGGERCIVIMGVAGSGKSTIGRKLAAALVRPFIEGDDFHGPASIQKMANGVALTDSDRSGWLDRLHAEVRTGPPSVLACSALKRSYRDTLRGKLDGMAFVYLAGDFQLFFDRLSARAGHYMGATMLESQFADLEVPSEAGALHVDASRPVDEIVLELTGRFC